jgi:hypothetical protein
MPEPWEMPEPEFCHQHSTYPEGAMYMYRNDFLQMQLRLQEKEKDRKDGITSLASQGESVEMVR